LNPITGEILTLVADKEHDTLVRIQIEDARCLTTYLFTREFINNSMIETVYDLRTSNLGNTTVINGTYIYNRINGRYVMESCRVITHAKFEDGTEFLLRD